MFKKNIVFNFILIAGFIGLSSWGFLVHRTVNQLAVYNLPAPLQGFFHANMEYLVENAPRPDNRKRFDKTEDTKHFIDLEAYGPNAANEMPFEWDAAVKKYGKDSLIKWGWGPYNAMVQLDNLTAAFKDYLGWIPTLKKEKLTNYGNFQITIHPTSNQSERLEIIEIRIPNQKNEFAELLGRKNKGYFIEVLSSESQWSSFLDNTNLNQNIEGVFVTKTDGYNSWLLDMSPSQNINFYGQIEPDVRDVVLKPGMIFENQEISINNISKNQDGSFVLEINIKE